MRRRDALRCAGALGATLVAGCLGESERSPPRDTSTAATARTTAAQPTTDRTTTERTTRDTTARPPPAADDLSAEAETLRASTNESPARITVTLANAADRDVRLHGGGNLPFSTYWSDGGGLLLIPDDRQHVRRKDGDAGGFVPESRTNGCWQSKAMVVAEAIGVEAILGPDESVSSDFTVLADSECPPAGTYTFENEIAVNDGRARATPLRELVVELALERNADGDVTSSSATVQPVE